MRHCPEANLTVTKPSLYLLPAYDTRNDAFPAILPIP
jgi:hypothetical protein